MTENDQNMIDDPNPDQEDYDLEDLPYDEEEEGDSGSGEGSGKPPKKRYRVIVEPFLDFADDPSLSPEENAERKLRLLAISPSSILVPGASSFASENDLSRKIFMVDVGQVNGEISPHDIADPDLIDKLDARQRKRRTLFGLPHPSLVLSGSMALASSMLGAFSGFAASVSGKNSSDKPSKKSKGNESKKAKLSDFSADKEAFGGVKEDPYKSSHDKPYDSQSVADSLSVHEDHFGELLEHATIETVTEMVEVKRTAISFDSLPSYFNYLSEIARAPVVKVELQEKAGKGGKSGKGGAADQSDAPSVPWQDFNPAR